VEGVTAVKAGGHFDGSLVLHWEDKLFIADTLVTVPVSDYLETGAVLADGLQSAYYQVDRQPGLRPTRSCGRSPISYHCLRMRL
jgi:glyoxylase-like metal-dependent hydrolase (beta-lactamase superfamily II)